MEMTPEDRAERENEVRMGQEARQLLDNELLRAALKTLELDAEREWKMSGPDEVEVRERAWRKWQTVRDFTGLLTRIISSGSLASEQLAADATSRDQPQEFDSPNERRTGIHRS